MADLSGYIRDKVYNKVLRGIDFTTPPAQYLALFIAITDAIACTGTEVSTSGTAYARQLVTLTNPAGTGAGEASADVVFAVATADWGTIVGACLVDTPSGAFNGLTKIKSLSPSKVVSTGDEFTVPAANLTVSYL